MQTDWLNVSVLSTIFGNPPLLLFQIWYLAHKGPLHVSTLMSFWVCSIDIFSLHVLFSPFRPRDVTQKNSFFKISSYARAYVKENSLENITWSKMGKQNVQAKQVDCIGLDLRLLSYVSHASV